MSESGKWSPLEEEIAWYFQEEAKRMTMPEDLSERIMQKATSPSDEKRIRRRGFRLLARGGMAAAAAAALLVAALFIWNIQQGTGTVDAEEILQRVEQTYQMGHPSQEIPFAGLGSCPLEGLSSYELAEVLPVLREQYGATVVSEETVEGRDQYVLLLVPREEDALTQGHDMLPPGAEFKLWVDKESNLVTALMVSGAHFGGGNGPDCGGEAPPVGLQEECQSPGPSQ
jgi:hypothetical protein